MPETRPDSAATGNAGVILAKFKQSVDVDSPATVERPSLERNSPRNRKLLSCQRPNQQHRTRSMVEDEPGDVSDRSRADRGFVAVFGPGANDH
jgi:hypothetical protein